MSFLAFLLVATVAGLAALVTPSIAQSEEADAQAGTAQVNVSGLGLNDTKRRVRKRDFDDKGTLPCAQEQGQSLGSCVMAVARSGTDATLVVTFPNGFSRQLYFVKGAFTSASATMSGVGTDIDWRLAQGTHFIRVDDQRYEVPDAFISGN